MKGNHAQLQELYIQHLTGAHVSFRLWETERIEPEGVVTFLQEFSVKHKSIREWFRKLERLQTDQKQRIVLQIADHTELEIPWELFSLSVKGFESRQFLGAMLPTVRFLPVMEEEELCCPQEHADLCQGEILSYILPDFDETGELLPLQQHFCCTSFRDMKLFRDVLRLKQAAAMTGLVYMACHGIAARQIHKLALGSDTQEEQRLFLKDLNYPVKLLKKFRSIIFLNACCSGVEWSTPDYIIKHRVSFVEHFLRKGARGVIATRGSVGKQRAAEIARIFFEELRRSPDTPVAEILRRLRVRIVEQLPEFPENEDLLIFLDAFKYVYYGDHKTVLKLTQRQE